MLTTAAWNAFLKTLEEPPPNTIFVLATTEADEGAADGRGPLPPVRLRAPERAADRRRAAARRRRARQIEIPDEAIALIARSATGLVPRRAGHARAAARLLGQRRSRSRTCWPCSAPPTPTSCSAPSTRSPPATAREALLAAARLADSGRDLGRFFADLEAHARGADGRADARRGARRAARHRRSRTSGWPSRRAASAAPTVVRLLELIAAACAR